MRRDVEAAENAWHDCAAQVDMVYDCQQKLNTVDKTNE